MEGAGELFRILLLVHGAAADPRIEVHSCVDFRVTRFEGAELFGAGHPDDPLLLSASGNSSDRLVRAGKFQAASWRYRGSREIVG